MKEINITNSSKKFVVDDEDEYKVKLYKWYLHDTKHSLIIKRTQHPQISVASYILDNNGITDHKNRDPFDNRRKNLRKCTNKQNCHNRKCPTNTSGFIGVIWRKDRHMWEARVRINGVDKYLGRFYDPKNAAKTYDEE